jgi:small subunit ribosomal protein S16
MGAKKRPFYRIVAADGRTARDGRFLEILGYYDPTTEPPTLKVDGEKATRWLGQGAQPSDTCRALLKKAGVISAAPPVAVVEEPAVAEVAEKPVRKSRKKAEPAEG